VIDTVALPIEQQVNGADGMIYMQSYAGADGSYNLTVTFKLGTDLNFAQVLVQNRVSSALSSLPQAVQVQGVNVQKKSTAILQIVTLTSPDGRYDSLYMSNFAAIRLKDEIARLPGVGNVTTAISFVGSDPVSLPVSGQSRKRNSAMDSVPFHGERRLRIKLIGQRPLN
jgi:HAE1 family hydrophobic/amphiphilic exporter-1